MIERRGFRDAARRRVNEIKITKFSNNVESDTYYTFV